MTTELKTDAELLRRLAEAARHQMTREELRLQRISFILGSMPEDSTVTRQQVEAVLEKAEGAAA